MESEVIDKIRDYYWRHNYSITQIVNLLEVERDQVRAVLFPEGKYGYVP